VERSGFSVHNRVYAHPGDGRDFEALVRYRMRSPVSLSRLRFTPGAKEVAHARCHWRDWPDQPDLSGRDMLAPVNPISPFPRGRIAARQLLQSEDLQDAFGALTIEDVRKDAMITVRIPRPTRQRVEALAQREGRSLSQQIERLIEKGLESEGRPGPAAPDVRPLAGLLAGEPSAGYGDFRAVRTLLSDALPRTPGRGSAGR
jgi:hypothetical protein